MTMMKSAKLSEAQQKLLDAMKGGVRVYFIGGLNAHYFRSDWKPIKYATAVALVDKGFAERLIDGPNDSHQLRLKVQA